MRTFITARHSLYSHVKPTTEQEHMFVIGITGTLGAGKGTVVDYLVTKKDFAHYSVRSFLREELNRRHMPVNRDSLTAIANTLRTKYGADHIVKQLFIKAQQTAAHSVIESIRTPGEIDTLRQSDKFYLLAVDADRDIRYKRIRQRNSETDQISYETFIKNEEREMHSSDPMKQNLSACIDKADFVVNNNGTISDLHRATEEFLDQIGFAPSSK